MTAFPFQCVLGKKNEVDFDQTTVCTLPEAVEQLETCHAPIHHLNKKKAVWQKAASRDQRVDRLVSERELWQHQRNQSKDAMTVHLLICTFPDLVICI